MVPSSEVLQAEQADAAGQHAEAISHLVVGARHKDVEAMTRLGKRLLIGDRAPSSPNDAVALLNEAAAAGGAEAAALMAPLYMAGAGGACDPRSALASLAMAAERGWSSARDQLLVLNGRWPQAGLMAGESWQQLAEGIDLDVWQTAPRGVDINADPLIRSFQSFVSPTICRWLIERARKHLARALVYEVKQEENAVHSARTNTAAVFDLLHTDVVCSLVQARICACLDVPFRNLEALTVLHYARGEQYADHYDFVDPSLPGYEQEIASKGQRIVTFVVYLNDDYLGGETDFPRLGVRHKGRATEGLFFVNARRDGSADTRVLHAGRAPTEGEKWLVSQFVRNRAL